MTDLSVTPDRRSYHRKQRFAIDSALKMARIDQQAGHVASYADFGTDYLAIVFFLLDDETFETWQRVQGIIHEKGETTERKLSDFADGGHDLTASQ